MNVDEVPETAARYGVQSIPLFLVIRDGEVEASILGAPGPGRRSRARSRRP